MLWKATEEIKILNNRWENYAKKHRLKNTFRFPKNVLNFINNLKFISCEDNKEFYSPTLAPIYEINDFPEFKLIIEADKKYFEIEKYPYHDSWFINSKPLKDFFKITSDIEKDFYNFFTGFKLFNQLQKINIEIKLNKYQNRFKDKSLIVKEVVFKNFAYYLIFTDGTEAKITLTKPPL